MSVVGAVLLLAIYHAVRKRSAWLPSCIAGSTPRASLSLRMGERIVGPRTYEIRQFDLANVAISSTALW